jgi:hypothetical protein
VNFFSYRVVLGQFTAEIVFLDLPVLLAGLFTAISGFGYVLDGLAQLQAKGHGEPNPGSDN